MKVKMNLDDQELQGLEMVKFEINDGSDKNIGTFLVGKAGIRWRKPKASQKSKAKSWNEVIRWLEEHGRTVTK
jgi:hypothetical protein